MKISFTRSWSSRARKIFSALRENFLITIIALVFVILKHSLQWRGEFLCILVQCQNFYSLIPLLDDFQWPPVSRENFYPAFFHWCFYWPYLVVQVYELITCVTRTNENAGNLISVGHIQTCKQGTVGSKSAAPLLAIWDLVQSSGWQMRAKGSCGYLAIIEWGWVGYEEFCRSRRVLSTEAEGRGG